MNKNTSIKSKIMRSIHSHVVYILISIKLHGYYLVIRLFPVVSETRFSHLLLTTHQSLVIIKRKRNIQVIPTKLSIFSQHSCSIGVSFPSRICSTHGSCPLRHRFSISRISLPCLTKPPTTIRGQYLISFHVRGHKLFTLKSLAPSPIASTSGLNARSPKIFPPFSIPRTFTPVS